MYLRSSARREGQRRRRQRRRTTAEKLELEGCKMGRFSFYFTGYIFYFHSFRKEREKPTHSLMITTTQRFPRIFFYLMEFSARQRLRHQRRRRHHLPHHHNHHYYSGSTIMSAEWMLEGMRRNYNHRRKESKKREKQLGRVTVQRNAKRWNGIGGGGPANNDKFRSKNAISVL